MKMSLLSIILQFFGFGGLQEIEMPPPGDELYYYYYLEEGESFGSCTSYRLYDTEGELAKIPEAAKEALECKNSSSALAPDALTLSYISGNDLMFYDLYNEREVKLYELREEEGADCSWRDDSRYFGCLLINPALEEDTRAVVFKWEDRELGGVFEEIGDYPYMCGSICGANYVLLDGNTMYINGPNYEGEEEDVTVEVDFSSLE